MRHAQAAIALAFLISESVVLAEGVQQSVERGLEARYRELDRMVVEYDWYECRALLSSDPFDQTTWIHDDMAFNIRITASILRPHYRLQWLDEVYEGGRIDRAWIGGERISRKLKSDDYCTYVRSKDRLLTTGPIPLITPLELWQVFDIDDGLLDLLRAESLIVTSETDGTAVLSSDAHYPPPWNWRFSAKLDPAAGYLPLEMTARLGHGNGEIRWHLRTITPARFGAVEAITEAIIAMSNTGVDTDKWQVYHFKTVSQDQQVSLAESDLRPERPVRKAKILDEIALESVDLDDAGNVRRLETWTAGQRAADLAALMETRVRAQASQQTLRTRRNALLYIVALAGVVVIVSHLWLRRRRCGIPS